MTSSRRAPSGFSLIELMVVIAIVAIGLTLAVPYFGGAGKAAKERGLVARLQQDFTWARTAAGAADASALNSSLSGLNPTIVITLLDQTNGSCGWTTTINGTTDSAHSMTSAQAAAMAPGMNCANTTNSTATLPVSFQFTPQGTLMTSGNVTYTSSSGTVWPLMFLMSGSVINTNGLS